MRDEAQALRRRIRANSCEISGFTPKQYERHVEAIAMTVERTREQPKTMRRSRVA